MRGNGNNVDGGGGDDDDDAPRLSEGAASLGVTFRSSRHGVYECGGTFWAKAEVNTSAPPPAASPTRSAIAERSCCHGPERVRRAQLTSEHTGARPWTSGRVVAS